MIQSNNEFYNGINELILMLEAAGEKGVALALRNALSISSLPGEILGETRAQLRPMPIG